MKLIKKMLTVAAFGLGANAFADPYLNVSNGTQHFVVYVIYQIPSKPYASQVSVSQHLATGTAAFPDGESVKVVQYYLTYASGSSWGNPIIDNGCKALDKNHFYNSISMDFTENNGQVTASCTSSY